MLQIASVFLYNLYHLLIFRLLWCSLSLYEKTETIHSTSHDNLFKFLLGPLTFMVELWNFVLEIFYPTLKIPTYVAMKVWFVRELSLLITICVLSWVFLVQFSDGFSSNISSINLFCFMSFQMFFFKQSATFAFFILFWF